MWEASGEDQPSIVAPSLGIDDLTGGTATYPLCQVEARRLRAGGAQGVGAPSAALLSGSAERSTSTASSESLSLLGRPEDLEAMPDAEGHPDPPILSDVRHL